MQRHLRPRGGKGILGMLPKKQAQPLIQRKLRAHAARSIRTALSSRFRTSSSRWRNDRNHPI